MSSESTFRWCGLAAGVVAGALALASCADFSRGEPSPAATDAGARPEGGSDAAASDGAAVSFATDVYPLLVPTCQSCHATGQQAGDTQLLFTGDAAADYPTVIMFVDTSAPGRKPPAVQAERQRSPGRNGVRRGIARVPDHPALDRARSPAMNRRLNVVARSGSRRRRRRHVAACAQLESDAGPTVVVPGPTIVATGPHARHDRHDGRDHRHDQGRHGRELHLHQRRSRPSPPSTARASSPASRPARRR